MNYTDADTLALIRRLADEKAEVLAWVAEDPKNRWAGYPVQHISHWHEYGVFTVAQYDHYNLVSDVYECTKDVHGFKPNWSALMDKTDDELRSDLELLGRRADEQAKEEAKREAKAIAEFEANVANAIAMGAGDRATAIRWLRDAERHDYADDGYFEFCHGLPYGYLKGVLKYAA